MVQFSIIWNPSFLTFARSLRILLNWKIYYLRLHYNLFGLIMILYFDRLGNQLYGLIHIFFSLNLIRFIIYKLIVALRKIWAWKVISLYCKVNIAFDLSWQSLIRLNIISLLFLRGLKCTWNTESIIRKARNVILKAISVIWKTRGVIFWKSLIF